MNEKNNINYDVFIKGERVDLVVLTEDIVDKTNWYNWLNDEENTKNMQKHYFPNTKEIDELFCRTLGFVHEGISRKAVYKNGEYHDIYHHAMTIQNYGVNDEKV